MSSTSRRRVRFVAPGEVEVVTENISPPNQGEVRVRTRYSAVSPGTERLVYRGEVSEVTDADLSIEALKSNDFSYPLSYGYACVGEVEALGKEVSGDWLGASVFAFHPHVSRFNASPDSLIRLPASVTMTDGVMVPSLETALNLVMDARPMIGEKVMVFGQGVVGLLTTRLLADFPLTSLITVEPSEPRRRWSREMGADVVVDPSLESNLGEVFGSQSQDEKVDLTLELTGQPSVLNDAINCTGFDGRIVVGSWYGTKRAEIELDSHFHRSRIEIISSQVSTIAPAYRGRWSKSRRMSVVLDVMNDVHPGQLISDRFHPERASTVYGRLDSEVSMLQPIFVYEP